MKPRSLPIRRVPVSQGILKRLAAVTNSRRQHATAAAADSATHEDGGSKVSRALTIIFLIHVAAIGLAFFHESFLDGHEVKAPEATTTRRESSVATMREKLPVLTDDDSPYLVRPGDNYPRIAAHLDVEESALRQLNDNIEIQPNRILRIPPKRIVAVDPPEVEAIRKSNLPDRDRGLVEAVPVDAPAPRAILVKPGSAGVAEKAPVARPVAGQPYIVQPGDSVWRIANRFKVDQKVLMKANGISDARKLRTGMSLVIPR